MNYQQHQEAVSKLIQIYDDQCQRVDACARSGKVRPQVVNDRYAELDQFYDALTRLQANALPNWLFAVDWDLRLLQAKDAHLTGAIIRAQFKPGIAQLAHLHYKLYA